MKQILKTILLVSGLWAGAAHAVVCTSLSAGRWDSAARWDCGHIPLPADSVVIAHNNIQMRNNYTVAGLTINAAAVLNDNGNNLTVNGNVLINGQLGINQGGALRMRTAGATLSGTGSVSDIVIEIDAANIVVPAGSLLAFGPKAEIDVGANLAGNLTLNGTITAPTQTAGSRLIRVSSGGALTVGAGGTINAPNSRLDVRTNASVLNNGNMALRELRGRSGAPAPVFTQGINANLTLSIASCVAASPCSFNASASGNTVTYNAPATPIVPVGNSYFNLGGTGVMCPHTFTVLGSDPCAGGGTVAVTANPGTCVDDATLGASAWAVGLVNVGLSDNLYASAATTTAIGTQLTHYLKCSNYGFAIPAGATINGIAVRVERKVSSKSTSAKDNAMRIVQGGVIGAIDRSTATLYTAADVVEMHGGVADLWGLAWTPADINALDFGAAFSASVTTTKASARTLSVDHMPITVIYTPAATKPHHIQIEHDGSGQTCRAETLTLTACANAACTAPHFNTASVSGNVTWAGNPGGTLPFTIAAASTGQTTVLLPVTTAQTVTLATSAVSPLPSAQSSCINAGGGTACGMVFTAATACFDAVEVGATATPLFTKLAGTPFSLDILAATPYRGTLQVELVNAASGTCATYPSLQSQSTTFANQTRQTLNFTYANAAREVKVRVTGQAASSCSSGRFVIRPSSIALSSNVNADASGISASALPVVKAGAAFSLNAAAAAAGYDGTPLLNNALIFAHAGAVVNGTVFGVFGAADPVTGVATGNAFGYSEVGYFKVAAGGVYDDSFTAIDAAAGDCTNDFSNTLVGGKYGCKFGNTAASNYFGRFIPDHFAVTPGLLDNRSALCVGGFLVADGVTACAPTFTYMGETMDANFTLSAASTSGALTRNYHGAFARLIPLAADGTLAWAAQNAATNLTARLDISKVALNGVGSFAGGAAVMSVPLNITRGAAADGPYTALNLGIAPVDGDGVTAAFDLDTNGDAVFDRVQVNAASTAVRYGRIRVGNAHGSEQTILPVTASLEFFNGNRWVASADDNLTTMNSGTALLASNVIAPLASVTAYNPGIVAANAGMLAFRLNKPGVAGSADLSLTAPAYLPSVAGRITFGVYKGANQFIYLREAY